MTFDLQAAREIIEHMSPLPWIVLEDENGTMNIIRNPNHPMHKDGLEAWGWKEASETPDARGIAFMRAEFPRACDEISRLDREVSVARNLASLAKGIVDEQADRIKQLEGWLVEERAFQIENNPNRTLEWAHSDAIDRARDQLQAEDKL